MDWDHDQFASIFNEVYPSLCRFLECLLSFSGQAQEIAQEAFLRLYKRGPEGIPSAELRFWIYRVARNLAVNEIRKRGSRARLLGLITRIRETESSDPEALLQSTEREQLILVMLRALPEHQRTALLLREQEDMSYREIAQVLGASESKIKVDIFRARKTLRDRCLELNSGTRKICND